RCTARCSTPRRARGSRMPMRCSGFGSGAANGRSTRKHKVRSNSLGRCRMENRRG
ncbi:MAG: hypothetical protein AVDCRST_MAG91-3435, partial [uncultured Sphingomonadaceae bacterium]